MADNKGGSDLDVFEGLAKKAPRSAVPGLAPPPSNNPRTRTLLGGLGPGALPPPPPNTTTLPGGVNAPMPPPPMMPPPGSGPLPPVAPPPVRTGQGTLPPVVPPPRQPPTSTPLPPPPMNTGGTMPLPAALPPPARPPAKAGDRPKGRGRGPAVDMDWDDEEESTHVYDKISGELPPPTGPRPAAGAPASAAKALLAGSGGIAAAAMRPSAVPMQQHGIPSSPPAPQMPAPAYPGPPPQSRNEEATAIRPRPVAQSSGGSKAGVILGVIALLAVIAMGVYAFVLPKKGGLAIDVKTPNGASVPKAEVFIDGQKRCDTVPCIVRDLDKGSKTVKVIAPDFPPRDALEVVEAGQDKVVLITLEGASASAAITGVKAAGTQPGVKVFVDGAEKGPLPLELALPPGPHKLRFEAGERYEKLEQTVDVAQGQLKDLGNVTLKVIKGQVTLELVTQGASVTLVNNKRSEKRLPDALWKNPPVQLDIDPSEGWKLTATKKGFQDFTQALGFEDGQAEKTIKIELVEVGKQASVVTGPATAPGPGPGPGPGPAAPKPSGEAATPPPSGGGQATLNINSIPVSKVVLDGRPLGSTPKVGVNVPPGSHTVTFIHPEKGKKSITVTVKAGETKTAAVKF